jgi:hypothetical protein
MNPVRVISRIARFGLRTLLVPALLASTWLGLTSGRDANASISPSPATILATLSSRHDIPHGTRLTVGDPARPASVTYDDKGRVLLTAPHGQTFGSILWRGFGRLSTIAQGTGAELLRASLPATATAAEKP